MAKAFIVRRSERLGTNQIFGAKKPRGAHVRSEAHIIGEKLDHTFVLRLMAIAALLLARRHDIEPLALGARWLYT